MSDELKKQYYNSILNKNIKIAKLSSNGYIYNYYGRIIEVYNDSIKFQDYKSSKEFLLTFDGLSVLHIE